MKIKRVNFKDVATSAGVSFATVSRVATNSARVSPEILKRVTDAAQSLGVDLRRKVNSKVIGFILGNRKMLHPFHSLLLAGAEAYCTERGYHILFLPIQYGANVTWRDLQMPRILRRHDLVHGFILAGSNTQNLLDFLGHKRVRLAVLGNNMTGEWRSTEHDVVWFDDMQGAYEMVQHLLSLGHRDIWYVGNRRFPWFVRRYEGYCRAMSDAGLQPRPCEMNAEKDEDVGYNATNSILMRRDPITAVFAGDDASAQGVYKALEESGLRVPDDVSVGSFDDIQATSMHPAATSTRVFAEQLGRQLAQMLVNRIENPALPPQLEVLPTQLIQRQSCRAVKVKVEELVTSAI